MPPTLGQPPMPLTQPRSGTLHLTTGPLQPSLTRQRWSDAVLRREVARLVERGAVAALVRGALEQPLRAADVVELGHRRHPREREHEVHQRLGDVVGLRRAAGDVDDRDARLRLPLPAQVVGQAHRAGRVVLHRRDAAVGGARPDRDDRGGLRREAINPLVRGDRLARVRVVAHGGEVAVAGELLVRQRALEDQHERVELAGLGVPPGLHELAALLEREHGVVDDHARHARDGAGDDVLERGIGGRGHADRVPVATESRRHPDHVCGDRLGLVLLRNELGCGHAVLSSSIPQQIRGSGSPTS